MVIPSGGAARKAFERIAWELAAEIGRLSAEEIAAIFQEAPGAPIQIGRVVEAQAREVILQWLLTGEEEGDRLGG